jgi:hypothetical protein
MTAAIGVDPDPNLVAELQQLTTIVFAMLIQPTESHD